MFSFRSLLFRGASAPSDVPEDVQTALVQWQGMAAPNLNEVHYHCRYVILDVSTSGNQLERDQLLGISAVGVQQGGIVLPGDALYLDFSELDNDIPTVDRKLMAFLNFVGKQPIVCYHAPHSLSFLQRAFNERLGLQFQPDVLDLAWLLPSLFEDISPRPMPLDEWLQHFGMISEGRRASMVNVLMLARLFQRSLFRAVAHGIASAGQLLDESNASTFLRRSH